MKILNEWLIGDRNPYIFFYIFYSNVFLWNKLSQTTLNVEFYVPLFIYLFIFILFFLRGFCKAVLLHGDEFVFV